MKINKKMCPGCYRTDAENYCASCRKKLFDGAKVKSMLDFDPPKADNLRFFQEKTRALSISGVQLKYSLKLENKELVLTEKGGQYILKPIPPSSQILIPEYAPENEHLTMQIASQVFDITTAGNALIFFKDGTPAYITRRFDVKGDGRKYQQEDMAQLSQRSRQTHGDGFKYDGTYEEIGRLIRQYVAAAMPSLEQFFKIILFNYLFSNGDAHLKNFSLIESKMGDYILAPAYDLMSTVLHTPHESDTALLLYEGDMDGSTYDKFGFYGQYEFRKLAERLELVPKRVEKIIAQMLSGTEAVTKMTKTSFLDADTKRKYLDNYLEKRKRMEIVM